MSRNMNKRKKEKTIELFVLQVVLKMMMMMIIANNLLQYNYKSIV